MEEKYTLDINDKLYNVVFIQKSIKRIIINVDYNNKITVHFPQFCSYKTAVSNLYKHLDWLKKTVLKNERILEEMSAYDVIAGRKIWILGELYNIEINPDALGYSFSGNTLYGPGPADRIIKEIRQAFKERIIEEFYRFSERFQSHFGKTPELKIRKMQTRWGSCNTKAKRINLNLHLIHVPTSYIKYVIIHEFIHLIHPNHGPDFYKLLSVYYPDYKTAITGLKKYAFLLKI